ncbi:uncharacterized protein LOC129573570 [Sitodiplosis mosellana]|uniref:uncharacterized protein LOC129573570 n=1 Tax=Sitodiplosis mosellana TaxID=263140 RepID=UPI002443FAB9|nr:uncharacterized protein LOC129573570 [Sitodiplosis mosellana]
MPSAPPSHFSLPSLQDVESMESPVYRIGAILERFRRRVESLLAMVEKFRSQIEQRQIKFRSANAKDCNIRAEAALQKLDELTQPMSSVWQNLLEVFKRLKANVRRCEVDELFRRQDEFELLILGVSEATDRFMDWFRDEGATIDVCEEVEVSNDRPEPHPNE